MYRVLVFTTIVFSSSILAKCNALWCSYTWKTKQFIFLFLILPSFASSDCGAKSKLYFGNSAKILSFFTISVSTWQVSWRTLSFERCLLLVSLSSVSLPSDRSCSIKHHGTMAPELCHFLSLFITLTLFAKQTVTNFFCSSQRGFLWHLLGDGWLVTCALLLLSVV